MSVLQADSTSFLSDAEQNVASAQHHSHQLTPREVLSWLPKNATPEEQDSMIQAHFSPKPVHWSSNPDTLHLPGQPIGHSLRDVSLPTYYKESFFSKDSLFHPELPGGRLGVAGDPIPYTIAGDNLITSILLGCFVLGSISIAQTKEFILRQIKKFFYVPRNTETGIRETSVEMQFQFFFLLQTSLLLAITYFFFTRTFLSETFIIANYGVIGIYSLAFLLYFSLKGIAYWFVNWVFFDKKKNKHWFRSFSFLTAAEGAAQFPMILLLSFFGLSMESAVIYTMIVIILFKLLTFYKLYIIFFYKIGAFVQFFLYFCALEVVPLFALRGVLLMIDNYLKINF